MGRAGKSGVTAVMRDAPIDEMIEFALEELLAGDDGRRRALVRQMCLRWPAAPALSVVFAITSAASMIEDNLSRDDATDRLRALAFKLAAVLAADTYAVERLGHNPARARDLMHFWRRVDPYFLEL